jgi:hypothetical protein
LKHSRRPTSAEWHRVSQMGQPAQAAALDVMRVAAVE